MRRTYSPRRLHYMHELELDEWPSQTLLGCGDISVREQQNNLLGLSARLVHAVWAAVFSGKCATVLMLVSMLVTGPTPHGHL